MKRYSQKIKIILVSCLLLLVYFCLPLAHTARATDFTSTSFILRDPVITVGGERSTSTSFQYLSSLGQTVAGEITGTSFTSLSGFLYFPEATSPVLSATPGNQQVALSWTTSQGFHGNITNYEVGTALSSGGPFTFESVGNVTSFTKTGLTNGTTYFFKVKAFAGTLEVAQSDVVSATPVAPPVAPVLPAPVVAPPAPPPAAVTFKGRAYPQSRVTVLKDGQIAVTTLAGLDAFFEITLSGLSAGNYNFALYSEDGRGGRSVLLTLAVTLTAGASTVITGIFISPTIDVDKAEVKRGDNIAIFGQSFPKAEVVIAVNSEKEIFVRTDSDKNGVYLYNFDTSPLDIGQHFTKSKAMTDGLISSFSEAVNFGVSDRTVRKVKKKFLKGDLNDDGRVNLIDFSIAAFWYKRPLSDAFKAVEAERLNGDEVITLVDFSIMAYYWTG